MASDPSRRRVVLGAGALAACARSPTEGWPTLRIGYQKNGVLLLANSRGLLPGRLAPAGVRRVEWAEFGSGPPMLEAMRAGAIDFGAVGDTPPIFAQAAGSPIVYAAAEPLTGEGQGLVVPAASRARSVRDLKGRRIAFTKASSAHLFVVRALASAGLGLDDIVAVHLSPADASAAFASAAVDAWAIWDPFFAIAQQTQNARLIADGRGLALSNTFYVATRRLADGAPQVLGALLDALAQEAAWGNSHLSDCGALVQAASGLPQAIALISLRRGLLAVVPMSDAVIAAQLANADTLLRLRAIPGAIDIRGSSWTRWTPSATSH